MKTHTKTSLLLSFGLCTCLQMMACGPGEPTPTDQGVDMAQAMPDMPAQDMGCKGASCPSEEMGAVCGDGMLQQGEQCDDGNTTSGDGCDATCEQEVVAVCGDGVVQEGEACDAGEQPDPSCEYGEVACQVCDANCQLVEGMASWCGDGIVQQEQGETCDEGDQNDDLGACLTDCARPLPVKVFGGGKSTYTIMSNGTVYAWGSNDYGQLGDGTTRNTHQPVQVKGVRKIVDLVASSRTLCMLNDSGEVWCVGRGDLGQMGNGAFDSSVNPIQVNIPAQIGSLRTGNDSFCASPSTDRSLWCWGDDGLGTLGTPLDSQDRASPAKVDLPESVLEFVMGSYVCARLDNDQIWCWGDRRSAFGEPSRSVKDLPPEHIAKLDGAKSLKAAYTTLLFLLDDGKYYGVGDNRFEIFNELTVESWFEEPREVLGIDDSYEFASDVANHTCAIRLDGRLVCWGRNDVQQLSKFELGLFFVEVDALSNVKNAGVGFEHSCAIDGEDQVWCWGRNDQGQLGIPASEEPFGPQKVEFWPEP